MKGRTILMFALATVIALMGALLMLDAQGPAPLADTELTAIEAGIMPVEAPAILAIDAPVAFSYVTGTLVVGDTAVLSSVTEASQAVGDSSTMSIATQTLNIVGGTALALTLILVTIVYVQARRRPDGTTQTDRWTRSPYDCIEPAHTTV